MVCGLAERLRRDRFHVLAAGANQGAAFRFPVDGRWKAPDLVAERDGQVLVAEGKIHARELFKSNVRKFSDFRAMATLSSDPGLQALICAEVAKRMATYGEEREPSDLVVRTAIFAADDISPWRDCLIATSVLSFVVDVGGAQAARCQPSVDGWDGYELLGF